MQESETVQEESQERREARRGVVSELTTRGKLQLGFIGGLVAAIVAAMVAVAADIGGLLVAPWFLTLGSMFGGTGLPMYVALEGLSIFVAIGVAWGLVFAFSSPSYSVTKGLAFSGIQLLLTTIFLAVVTIPELGGTLIAMSIGSALTLIVGLAATYIGYGATIGYIGKKYLA